MQTAYQKRSLLETVPVKSCIFQHTFEHIVFVEANAYHYNVNNEIPTNHSMVFSLSAN